MMTRTDRRRFHILFAAIAVLALAGAALGLLLSTVRAQEAGTLLSNTEQETEAHTNTDLFYPAQGFITGSKAGGYVLTSIELDVATAPGDTVWGHRRAVVLGDNDRYRWERNR